MSFDEYCKLCDDFEEGEYKCEDWFPTKEDTDRMFRDLGKYLKFIIWLLETAPDEIKETDDYKYLQEMFEVYVEFE